VEAAHHLVLPASTVRQWCVGQRYPTAREGRKLAPPVVPVVRTSPPGLSFWNLVELYVLASIRRHHGVSLQKVRRAIQFVERELELQRPLIEQEFQTNGVDLFVEKYGELINASREGQRAMKAVLEGSLARIDRDPRGLAKGLFPWAASHEEPRLVEITPVRAFGRPVVSGTGIPTEVLAQRWRAGDSIDHLARDYGLSREQIEAAVLWEHRAAAV
jgi:uncharacterized protein (DUF433 family)